MITVPWPPFSGAIMKGDMGKKIPVLQLKRSKISLDTPYSNKIKYIILILLIPFHSIYYKH